MKPQLLTLEAIFRDIDALPWVFALYLHGGPGISLDSLGAVLDPNDCENGEELPTFAHDHSLAYVITIDVLKQIQDNLQAQKPAFDKRDLFRAFTHYLNTDSFIDVKADWHGHDPDAKA